MTRRKVKIAFISDDSTRRATYNRRKKGIIKKVAELTTLCDISACVIISNPFNSETEFWPNQEGAKEVIERYQNSSVKDATKNVNQQSLILQMITKGQEKLRKLEQSNHEKELTLRMFEYMQHKNLPDNLTVEELKDFDKLIKKNMKDFDDAKINKLN
ncbi:agamous MADS-box protein AGL80 [Trifolium repens]|jgi:hypothetical protein|nr:agamous MADS-box protein AGL80 [Trifolium repens]